MKTLENFAIKYEGLREVWGYRFDIQPNYENMTKDNLRPFQHITDYFMRFLTQRFATDVDEKTMHIEYDIYVKGAAFNASDDALEQYLKKCGPYFKGTRKACTNALKYLLKCPPSSTRCFLQVSLRWMKVVRIYYQRYLNKIPIRIRNFKKLLKATAIAECREYLKNNFNIDLEVNTVKEAMEKVKESDTSDENIQLRL